MLKKTLAICALTVFAFIGLQAIEQDIPPSSNPVEMIGDVEKSSDLLGSENAKNNDELLACAENVQEENSICEDEIQKDLTPGALVCNEAEDECTKDGEKEESKSSSRFTVFKNDKTDETLLARCCKKR